MAIRVNKNKLKLSTLQVQEARILYYLHCRTAISLAWDYEVSESVMRDAIYGKRGYAKIPDPEKLKPEDKKPENRAEWKSNGTNPESRTRRQKRQFKKWELDYLKNGGSMAKTKAIDLPSPSNIDWKDEERKARVAQNRHWKGWD